MESVLIEMPIEENSDNFYGDAMFTLCIRVCRPEEIADPVLQYAMEENFSTKGEHHIALIGYRTASALRHVLEANKDLAKCWTEILDAACEIDMSYTLLSRYAALNRCYEPDFDENDPNSNGTEEYDERWSIVQFIEMPGLDELYALIGEKLGVFLAPPLPHITLWSRGTWEKTAYDGIALEPDIMHEVNWLEKWEF